ncbi:DUF6612 family protein [Paenibacillus silvae]|uniref:LppX_LprAFG lipoprotein n=1 Tax=Paenibacillus silvae TaxID=1325358 RepID=A0A2W6PBK5_9BACL|nr:MULTISPECIES: DUF6612 family protein [Paenibacillus]MCK6074806.1 hypothetical protein [Paenibacillus silvae]MCK6147719.1 hypothetical protein [Paenibacillus silvae]MCK6266017.1 hypothetical protein [Paenibacillus silvae]PZT55436.1 hypothetical protein DN757_12215 [Paenibacillus silvae]
MKKWTTMIIGALLVMSLAACGNDKDNSAAPATGSGSTTTESNNTEGQSAAVPTLDELLAKTGEATKALKSFTTEANIDQQIKVDAGEQSQDQQVKTSLKMDIIKDPMMIYQEMEMDMSGQKQNVKQYITSENIYSQVGDQWVSIPEAQTKELIEQMKASMNPEKELDQFKKVKDDIKITEEGDSYVLNADVSGDNVKELAKSVMEQNGSDAQMQALLDQMNIKSMKMKYWINKETSLLEKMDVAMVMEMEQSGQKMTMDMKMDTSFSNHDKVAEIKVPQEALDAAK